VTLPPSPRYSPEAQGLASARKALAEALGYPALYEQLCLTSGSSEALGVALKLLADAGDEVLVGAPGYPLVEVLAGFEGLRCIPFPLRLEDGAFRWDMPLLEERLGPRTRAVVVTSPQVPTGCCLLPEEVLALETFCAKHGLALLVDQVFALGPHSLAGHPWKCLTFLLGGLSKWLGLPQHKLAWTWVLGPAPLVHEALRRWLWVADAYLCLATPVQEALASWLPLAEGFQSRVEARCQRNHACLARLRPAGAAWDILPREAGWTAALRVPIEPGEEGLALRLLEEGVAVWPGYFFDIPVEGFVAVSLLPEEASFEEAASRIAQVLKAT
jgi:aspartate/methionine/tyrosine aminotransferase